MLRPGLLLYKNNNPGLLLYKNNNQKAGQAAPAPSLPGTGLCRIVFILKVGWRDHYPTQTRTVPGK